MINYLHAYSNSRPGVDWNTCGQAAIATVTDYWGHNPYGLPHNVLDTNDHRYHWTDGAAIDAIKAGGYGPDVVFGWGTTGGRIRDALTHYGMPAQVGYSGFFSYGWQNLWNSLQNYVTWNRPVPVMLDLGAMHGPAWGVHWAVAYKVAGGRVYLGNCPWNPAPLIGDFLNAWHCWFLPYGFNHCGVYA